MSSAGLTRGSQSCDRGASVLRGLQRPRFRYRIGNNLSILPLCRELKAGRG